jgi:hypothetical protein
MGWREHGYDVAFANVPPVNVKSIVESSPSDALIGVWLSK